jgi:hypothetical protein
MTGRQPFVFAHGRSNGLSLEIESAHPALLFLSKKSAPTILSIIQLTIFVPRFAFQLPSNDSATTVAITVPFSGQ